MDSSLWDSSVLGKNRVDCHSLLQGTIPAQGWIQLSCIANRFFTIWVTREDFSCSWPIANESLRSSLTDFSAHIRETQSLKLMVTWELWWRSRHHFPPLSIRGETTRPHALTPFESSGVAMAFDERWTKVVCSIHVLRRSCCAPPSFPLLVAACTWWGCKGQSAAKLKEFSCLWDWVGEPPLPASYTILGYQMNEKYYFPILFEVWHVLECVLNTRHFYTYFLI